MQLSSSHFKTWVLTLCMAKEGDGTLPSIDVIAFKLRLRVDVAKQHIEALVSAGLIDRNESQLSPHNWDKYQYASDVSTTRVERFRERKKNVSGNDNETFQKPPQRTENREQNTDIPQTPNASASAERVSAKAALKAKQVEWFDQWWPTVWRKTDRKDALEKFFQLVIDEKIFSEVMSATKIQTPRYLERPVDKQPHPATWLNKRRWEDDPAAYVQSQPQQPTLPQYRETEMW